MYIYVLDKDGKPLMPTRRAGKVRRMLRDGRAVIAGHAPFTIRLAYATPGYVQPLVIGVDAGSEHVGISVSSATREVYAAQADLRTDIPEKLATRREARRTSRSEKTRYRAPRFDNRHRPEGWLPPTTRQKVDSHVKIMQDVCKILPVKEVVIETAQFDMQKIKNPDICGEQYQQGDQLGFWNVREYVLWRDGHECQCCHGKSKDKILNVHHIESRKTGGDSPDNLVTLCETCHNAYHTGKIELKLKRNFRSLRGAAMMNVMRWEVLRQAERTLDGIDVRNTYGYMTKSTRIRAGLAKSHVTDALCIAGHPQANRSEELLVCKQLRRHNRKVMKSNMLSGGRWKRNQAPREIKGFRLWDTVEYNRINAYVHGRRNSGYFVIKDPEGETLSNSVSYKSLSLIRHNNKYLYNLTKNRPIPPTNEFVGFLGQLS